MKKKKRLRSRKLLKKNNKTETNFAQADALRICLNFLSWDLGCYIAQRIMDLRRLKRRVYGAVCREEKRKDYYYMKKGQILEGTIEKIDFPNKGIVRAADRQIIVKNGVPGRRKSVFVSIRYERGNAREDRWRFWKSLRWK